MLPDCYLAQGSFSLVPLNIIISYLLTAHQAFTRVSTLLRLPTLRRILDISDACHIPTSRYRKLPRIQRGHMSSLYPTIALLSSRPKTQMPGVPAPKNPSPQVASCKMTSGLLCRPQASTPLHRFEPCPAPVWLATLLELIQPYTLHASSHPMTRYA